MNNRNDFSSGHQYNYGDAFGIVVTKLPRRIDKGNRDGKCVAEGRKRQRVVLEDRKGVWSIDGGPKGLQRELYFSRSRAFSLAMSFSFWFAVSYMVQKWKNACGTELQEIAPDITALGGQNRDFNQLAGVSRLREIDNDDDEDDEAEAEYDDCDDDD